MSGEHRDADVIIVGGGVVGLWTSYHLARQGVKTLLLEQFFYPHTRGSSHGQSRITRTSYVREEYAALASEAMGMWRQLEEESNRNLLINTGLLSMYDMRRDEKDFRMMVENLKSKNINHYILPGEDLERNFPGLVCTCDTKAIFDAEAGVLKADMCLEALRESYKARGGQLQEGQHVTSVRPIHDYRVEVETKERIYTCKSVVLTCGAYINKLLASVNLELPVQTKRVVVNYWRDRSGRDEYSLSNKFPCTCFYLERTHFYTIPSYEYPGLMKISGHEGTSCDPANRDARAAKVLPENEDQLNWLKNEIRVHYPEIDAEAPAIMEICMYTETPDARFILDYHPKHKNIVIGSGFSGHGFKTAPSVGHILAQMALGLNPTRSLEPFLLKRFKAQSKL